MTDTNITPSPSQPAPLVRNTRHGFPERATIKGLMVHEGQTHHLAYNSMGTDLLGGGGGSSGGAGAGAGASAGPSSVYVPTTALPTAAITGGSKWKLPRRARTEEHYHKAREHEGLSRGLAGFYGDPDEVAKGRDGYTTAEGIAIGDTTRRHFEAKPSEEVKWKKGFKTALPEITPARPRGKKHVQPYATNTNDTNTSTAVEAGDGSSRPSNALRPPRGAPGEEVSDIPRGRKHVTSGGCSGNTNNNSKQGVFFGSHGSGLEGENKAALAAAALEAETSAMGRKKLVVDGASGMPVSWKGPPFFPPTEDDETLFEGLRSSKKKAHNNNNTNNGGGGGTVHTEDHKRNGIPCKVPGDLPYKTVEEAPGYVQATNPKNSKCGYEKQGKPFVFNDKFAAKENSARRTQEISDVRALPNY